MTGLHRSPLGEVVADIAQSVKVLSAMVAPEARHTRRVVEELLETLRSRLPIQARDMDGPIWLHSCGLIGYGESEPRHCYCDDPKGDTWKALYVLGPAS